MATELGVAFISVAASTKRFAGDMRKALRGTEAEADRSSKRTGAFLSSNFGRAFTTMGKVGVAAVGALTGAFIGNTKAGVKFNAAMQGYEVAFRVLTGSAQGAATALQAVEDVKVSGTGLDKRALAAASQQLLGVGVSADDLGDRLIRLAKASLDNADTFGVLTRYYAAATAGAGLTQVQLDSLAARGFNPLQIIADHTGRSLADVSAEFSGAQGNADALRKAVQLATDAGGQFYNTFDYMSGTIVGAMNVAQNEIQVLQSTLAQGLMPYLSATINAFTPMITRIREMAASSTGLQDLWTTLGTLAVTSVERLYDVVVRLAQGFFDLLDRVRFDRILDQVGALRDLLLPLGGTVLGVLGSMASQIPIVGKAFSGLSGPVGLILGLFAAMFKHSPELRAALSELATTIGDTLLGAAGALTPLLGMVGELFAVVAGTAGDALAQVLGMVTAFLTSADGADLLTGVLSAVQAVLTLASRAISRVVDVAGPLITRLVDAATNGDLFARITGTLTRVLTRVVGALERVLDAVLPVVIALFDGDAGARLLDAALGLIVAVLPGLIDLAANLLTWIVDLAAGIVELAAAFVQWDGALYVVAAGLTVGLLVALGKAKAGLAKFKASLLASLAPLGKATLALWKKTAAVLANPLTWKAIAIKAAIAAVVAGIVWMARNWEDIWAAIASFVTGIVDRIRETITRFVNAVRDTWERVWGAVRSFTETVWSAIRDFIDRAATTVRDVVTRIVNAVRDTWERVWGAIRTVAETVWSAISTVVTTYIDVVRTIITTVLDVITGLWRGGWDGVRDILTGIWDTIRETVRSGVEAVTGWFTGLRDTLTTVFSGVASAISAPFRAAFDGIRSAWNNTVGGRGFSIPSWVPGLGGNEFRIPALATGGITLGPTLALIGDNPSGHEMVLPLERMGEFIDMVAPADRGGGGTTNLTFHTNRVQPRDVTRALQLAELLEV